MIYDHHDPEFNEEEWTEEMAYKADMARDNF